MSTGKSKNKSVRIVVDSNVIISALQFGGLPNRVLSSALDANIRLFISPFIADEILGVLLEKFSWDESQIQEAEEIIEEVSETIQPSDRVNIARDSDDNRILECALAAQAHYLISGDDDLLSLKKYGRIEIVTPAQFLARLAKT